MRRNPHIALLGAGIMGSATALFLAQRGARVTLFDANVRPFCGASRWSEGKIHLGYLYSADPSLETARRVLPGGLAFKDLTEALLGCSLEPAITPHEDTYLIHRESVTTPAAMDHYVEAVTSLATSHADANRYLVDISGASARRLTRRELEKDYDTTDILGGYRLPERSVSTRWVADRFVDAFDAEQKIELAMQTRILAVRPASESLDGPLVVDTARGPEGPFDFVVNALWEGRIAIDADLGINPVSDWSHRFRLALFLKTRASVTVPNTVLATGPFGDIKNYNGTDFYLSWYPIGLIAQGSGLSPPSIPPLNDADRERIIAETLNRLGQVIRSVKELEAHADEMRLEGGWVYAIGQGSLADPKSTLHRRDRIGIQRVGSYISADTGKYSIAPWLAKQIADSIVDTRHTPRSAAKWD